MPKETRIYYEDLLIAQKLLDKDRVVTTEFFYKSCYPLFQSLFAKFYTDCNSGYELMNEIYLLIITPSKSTGKCQLQNYKGESSLRSWIKAVAQFYCYGKFNQKKLIIVEPPPGSEKKIEDGVRNGDDTSSFSCIDRDDLLTLISLMPNKRYAKLIRLRYYEQYSNEETAKALGIKNMDNYYNIHRRAKEQFEMIVRKEGRYD